MSAPEPRGEWPEREIDELVRIGAKLGRLFWALLILAFSLGGYVATSEVRAQQFGKDLEQVRAVVVARLQERVLALELAVSPEILPRAQRELDDLERRIRMVERRIGTSHPPDGG